MAVCCVAFWPAAEKSRNIGAVSGNVSYFGVAFPPPAPIEAKFYTAKRTQLPIGRAKFDVNRCKESPLQGKKNLIFGLWVNLIPAVCRFAASCR